MSSKSIILVSSTFTVGLLRRLRRLGPHRNILREGKRKQREYYANTNKAGRTSIGQQDALEEEEEGRAKRR